MPNLLLVGVGGQGVNTLANVLAQVIEAQGVHCQYTVHKGGAQSLGSIYAELRIPQNNEVVLGPSIPQGNVDVVIALDPWEALRHTQFYSNHTQMVCEQRAAPFYVERHESQSAQRLQDDPVIHLARLPFTVTFKSYRDEAIARFADPRMANYLAGMDGLWLINRFNLSLYQQRFYERIPTATLEKGRMVL